MPLSHDTIVGYLQDRHGLSASDIDGQTPLFSSGLIDSFGLVELIAFIEKEAGLRIPAADVNLDNLDSVQRIIHYASKHNPAGN